MTARTQKRSQGMLPEGEALTQNVIARRRAGRTWQIALLMTLVISVIALLTLLATISNDVTGYVIIEAKVNPATLADRPLEQLSKAELTAILQEHISRGLFRRLERDQPLAERTQADLLALVYERVVEQRIVESYNLWDSIFNRAQIDADLAGSQGGRLEWRSWINLDFFRNPMASVPELAGIRNAILGSLWMIALTMLIAFPIGVGAAIYLEEYAEKNWINSLIETNINNLAGVPSIIYGMLGLAIFVRVLERYTSGAVLGMTDTNGRTIISASLTMALLILPLLIINAREAIRAVPQALRQASYGLGATRWQTVWYHVLPEALPGIMTGTILGMSRAIGETAPLIVVGASTFIVTDPSGPFSKFTALPIQIYNWTQQPSDQFHDLAAAAILILLCMLLSLNALAIFIRNRFRRER